MIPLFVEKDRDLQKWSKLPRWFPREGDYCVRTRWPNDSETNDSTRGHVKKIIDSSEVLGACVASSIVGALYLVLSGVLDVSHLNTVDNNVDDDMISTSVTLKMQQSWKLVRDKIAFNHWKKLVFYVCRHQSFVYEEHPLCTYAVHQIPLLSTKELAAVIEIMELEAKRHSPLAVQKQIRDFAEKRFGSQRQYLVLIATLRTCDSTLDQANTSCKYPQSCLPTARLELSPSGNVAIIALFDCEPDEISICYTQSGEDVERRDAELQLLQGCSCMCLRCHYEIAESSCDLKMFSLSDVIRLGHFYFSQGGPSNFDYAKRLYKYVLKRHQDGVLNNTIGSVCIADVHHANGAMELSTGKFLNAQRIWSNAAEEFPSECLGHPGIAVQLEKIQAYNYLGTADAGQTIYSEHVPTESPFAGAFVAHVVDAKSCQQVVDWTEQLGKWTQQRHYAVPTHDVAVHTVPILLHWFQNDFMNTMKSLLASCFEKKPSKFFVHDAFCVRYEAGSAASHLPVHTDESTHSFVLALNDDFDGGGTYFYDHDTTVHLQSGRVLCFCGDKMPHGGEAVTRGVRYILAAFLYYDDGDCSQSVGVKRQSHEITQIAKEPKHKQQTFAFHFSCADS